MIAGGRMEQVANAQRIRPARTHIRTQSCCPPPSRRGRANVSCTSAPAVGTGAGTRWRGMRRYLTRRSWDTC